MFDFSWSEIAVIAGVALVLIGPKDMPVAIRTISDMIKKARRMAGEFQTHVDEMMREANLDEVRQSINEIRNFNLQSEVERTVDPDGSLRSTFAENPFEQQDQPAAAATLESETSTVPATGTEPGVAPEAAPCHSSSAAPAPMPAFLPPNAMPPTAPAPEEATEPPPFIPPEVVRAARMRNG
jgi:sec-independent protein translocase protein TatB